ncbi:F-box only protein 4, partial [Bienertia sinuspersici]
MDRNFVNKQPLQSSCICNYACLFLLNKTFDFQFGKFHKMKHLSGTISVFDLPYDIAFKVASLLHAGDVCALGSCSKFWREWPSLQLSDNDDDPNSNAQSHLT